MKDKTWIRATETRTQRTTIILSAATAAAAAVTIFPIYTVVLYGPVVDWCRHSFSFAAGESSWVYGKAKYEKKQQRQRDKENEGECALKQTERERKRRNARAAEMQRQCIQMANV